METSIVVSMYNKGAGTIEVIDKVFFPALIRNSSKNKEVIILDDLSPLKKETQELVKKHMARLKSKFGRVVFMRNEKNLGFAGSYNKAISLARGRNLIVTNDDVYFPRNSIDTFVSSLNENKEVGAVGPITGWKGVSTYQYCKQGPKLRTYSPKEFSKIERFAARIKNLLKDEPLKKVEFITGFCFAAKRDIVNKVGGFDNKFLFGHIEDTDLIMRIGQKSDVVINTGLYIHHGGINGASVSVSQHPIRNLKFKIINTARFIKKWNLWRYLKMIAYMLPRCNGYYTVSDLIKEKQKI